MDRCGRIQFQIERKYDMADEKHAVAVDLPDGSGSATVPLDEKGQEALQRLGGVAANPQANEVAAEIVADAARRLVRG